MITISINIEEIPEEYKNYPEVSITLKCRPSERWKAEMLACNIRAIESYTEEA